MFYYSPNLKIGVWEVLLNLYLKDSEIPLLVAVSVNQEQFQQEYTIGKDAFGRGNYRTSVTHLETAHKLVKQQSRLGGEVGIWLITAYQAVNRSSDAIALCQKLSHHPHAETRQQCKRLLYILQAPALKRPKEWMVEIPDLGVLPDSDPKDRRGSNKIKPKKPKLEAEPEPIDLTQVNTEDNRFTWLALIVILITLGGLWWFS